MAMALAARGDFLATSAVAGVGAVVALTTVVLAGEAADLLGEFLVALVTDGVAVFAVVGFLAEGGVLTGVLDTWPCRGAVEVLATAFLAGTAFEGLDADTGFLTTAFLAGAAFLATSFLAGVTFLATAFLAGAAFLATSFLAGVTFLATAFLAGAVFLATAFLATAFCAGAAAFLAVAFLAGAPLATGFFTAALGAEAAFLATVFLTGALAAGFDLPLALAFCLVDFTAYLLSAGPGKFKENSPTADIFLHIHQLFLAIRPYHLLAIGARIVLSLRIVLILA